jgi:hypothetical protein
VSPYDAPASHAPYSTHDHPSYDRRASSSTQTSEALRKQQEEFARAAELRQMLANLEKVDDEGRRGSLLDTLCSTEDILDLPEHPNPPGIASGELRVDLLRHQVCGLWCRSDICSIRECPQKQALQWAIEHENPKLPTQVQDKPVQFWQYRKKEGIRGVRVLYKSCRDPYSGPCRTTIIIVRASHGCLVVLWLMYLSRNKFSPGCPTRTRKGCFVW